MGSIHAARAVTHRNGMISENTRFSFHCYSDPGFPPPRLLVRITPAKATPTAKIASISPLMLPPNPFGLFFNAFKQDQT